jgi:hypothetical protein
MAIQTEPQRAGEHLLSPNWSIAKDNVTVKMGEKLVAGQLLEEDTPATATDFQIVVAYAGGAPIGALWDAVDATEKVMLGVAHKRICEFAKSKLTGLDAAAETALAASPSMIILREDV